MRKANGASAPCGWDQVRLGSGLGGIRGDLGGAPPVGCQRLPKHAVGLATDCHSSPWHMLWGFFDTVGFAMARAMVLPWAATVSATARAMGTIICHVAWQRHDRWQPVGLAMETHGLRWQPMACDGSPWLTMAAHGKPHGLPWSLP